MENQNGWEQQMWPKLQNVIKQGQNESAQGLRLKIAEIGKKKQGTESNKSDQIPELIDGGQIERACLLTDVINDKQPWK